MKHRLDGDNIIHGDIISPEVTLATFSKGISNATKKHYLNTMNYGDEMLMVYRRYRDNMHIENMVEMIREMEKIFQDYDIAEYSARREDLKSIVS